MTQCSLCKKLDNRGDRSEGVIIAGFICAAVSGFVMGFLMRGDVALAFLVLMSALLSGCVGWWLRVVALPDEGPKR